MLNREMKMKKLLILSLLLVGCNGDDSNNDTNTTEEPSNNQEQNIKICMKAIINAKIAGMCNTLTRLTVFQNATKMNEGGEFIARFVKTEAARLGFTSPHALLNHCEMITKTNEEVWNIFQDKFPDTFDQTSHSNL